MLVKGYTPSAADIASWNESKTVGNREANAFVQQLQASAPAIVAQWNATIDAYNGYKRASSSGPLAMGVKPSPSPTAGSSTYTIVAGDNVSSVAKRFYGVPLSNASMQVYTQLASSFKDPNKVKPGDKMTLPPSVSLNGKTYQLNTRAPAMQGAGGSLS
jgi:nucleoid-associated protein YgaU